ncbi:MAG TPA: pitrilysin family protein [Candidatus Methylomirabilis sp.]|nr:pitrilysin family protein [Candidatus Methylomirabilis sp.]
MPFFQRRASCFLLIIALCGFGRTAAAASLPQDIRLPITQHTLRNGMQVLIVERRESPTFSAYLRFKVGSASEPSGQTGLAHLLEHMMFKGTGLFGTTDPDRELPILERIDRRYAALQAERAKVRLPGGMVDATAVAALEKEIAGLEAQAKTFVIRNELWDIYRRNGGTRLNASTSREGTQYFVSLPKNRLELWALLESDRMRNPVFREFYTERDVVFEERRERVDTSPRGQLLESALAAAFVALPYRHPVLGWPGELENLSRPQAREFFRTYYAPNNAVAVLVGDLDPAEVIRTMERYFGDIPAQSMPPPPVVDEPPQRGERRLRVEFPAEPQLLMLYRVPPLAHRDTYALNALGTLLGEGRSSRLHTRLVEKERLATSVTAGPWFLRHAGLFLVQATPRSPHTLEELERAIEEEVARAQAEPPTERELLKVRNQIEVEAIRSLASNAGLASHLGNAWALTGDWGYVFEERERNQAVTAEEVVAVASRYLAPEQRIVAWLVRGGSAAPGRPAGRPSSAAPWESN